MAAPSFQQLRVLAFESRRSAEMASIIRAYGGAPISAPAMREVPLESNTEAFAFVDACARDAFEVLVALTGVGLRSLVEIADRSIGRAAFAAALTRMRVAARGPKPLAVLRELGVTPWVVAPPPNTWKELLSAIDGHGDGAVRGAHVAVQEYGTSSAALVDGLERRGARVHSVPIYRYALPEDLAPLEGAVRTIAGGEAHLALFTTATQVLHLIAVADRLGLADAVRSGLGRLVVASIGPTTSDALMEHGITVDLEASHPKMGVLVRDAAERGPALLEKKRTR